MLPLRALASRVVRSRLGQIFPKSILATRYIWIGVYDHFRDVPALGEGHAVSAHIETTKTHTRSVLETLRTPNPKSPPAIPSEYAHFPMLAALDGIERRELSVLDVGGGLGIGYIYLRAS